MIESIYCNLSMSCLHFLKMQCLTCGQMSLCLINVMWLDFDSLAFMRHFFSHSWIFLRLSCKFLDADIGSVCDERISVSKRGHSCISITQACDSCPPYLSTKWLIGCIIWVYIVNITGFQEIGSDVFQSRSSTGQTFSKHMLWAVTVLAIDPLPGHSYVLSLGRSDVYRKYKVGSNKLPTSTSCPCFTKKYLLDK